MHAKAHLMPYQMVKYFILNPYCILCLMKSLVFFFLFKNLKLGTYFVLKYLFHY